MRASTTEGATDVIDITSRNTKVHVSRLVVCSAVGQAWINEERSAIKKQEHGWKKQTGRRG